MLTETTLKHLKPKDAVYKVADRDGMYVTVSVVGTISFRFDYRLNGRRETLTLGRYGPDGISLAVARERCVDARRAISEGRSPAQEKQREKRRLAEAQTFQEFSDQWAAGARMAASTRSMRGLVVRLALAACASAAALPVGAAAEPPAQGHIVYDVHYGSSGFKVGEARHEWKLDKGRYALSLALQAKGLAGLFGLEYEQRSSGTVDAKGMRPELFEVDQRGRKPERAEFDWTAGKVSIRRGGEERRNGEIRAGDQDLLSLWHQARKVVESGKPARFAVITNKSIKQAVVEPRGEERLELAGEQLDTVRLHAFAEKDDLDIDIWLSRRHSLLPVRIRITDDKGGVLDQRAARIEAGVPAARNPN